MGKTKKLFELLRTPAYWRGAVRGVAASVEHERFLRNGSYGSILDVGANRGQFALAARKHQPTAMIFAFEPLDAPALLFRRMFGNDKKVHLINKALGSCQKFQQINISERDDSSSLLPIGSGQTAVFPGTGAMGVETVEVTTLDLEARSLNLCSPVLLKIDVQGFELEVLRGARECLSLIESVYVELSYLELYTGQPLAHEVMDWLREYGFVVSGVYNTVFAADGRPVQSDVYFRRIL
jgi:FkbM family methyltransferase